MTPLLTFIAGALARKIVENDLTDIVVHLGRDNPQTAFRFAAALQETLKNLVEMPHLGSSRETRDQRLHGLRAWPVKDFKNYLIFYRPFASGDGLEVIRVLHHSRDAQTHLADEETFED